METALLSPSALSQEDRARWGELAAHRFESGPFVDEAWVLSWMEAYRPQEPVLLCGREGGKLVGLAALHRFTERWAGREVRVLQSLTNVESPRFDFLSWQSRLDIEEQLWRGLCERGQADVIRLDHLPEESPTLTASLTVARELGWRPLVELMLPSPWRALLPPPVPWDEGLARKFKANLRNRERRLQRLGQVMFEVVSRNGGDRRPLQIFYELEASGWKAARGTAIVQRPNVKAFYDCLVDRAAEHIWLPILWVGDKPAAAQLVRVSGRTMFLLKTAYHPEFSPYAPGQLLTARLIHYGIENGMDVLDFLGENMTWKADWAPRLRQRYQLLLFSPSLIGRYAYWMRYGLRELAKQVPGLQRLVHWLRTRPGGSD